MRTLPPIIRDYLSAGKYTTVARNLTTKYGLRIDQAGVLEREIMLLLMGIETPQEFAQALTEEARLDKKIVDSIALDVNEQVFIPLRTEEQKIGMGKLSQPAMSEAKKETEVSAAEPAQKSSFSLENKIEPAVSRPPARVAPHVAPLPPRFLRSEPTTGIQLESHNRELSPKTTMSLGPSATLGDVVRSILPVPTKPLDRKLLLEDHEEPSPSLKSLETPTPKPEESLKTPLMIEKKIEQPQTFGSRIIPNSVPVNLPGTFPEVQIPVTVPQTELRVPLPVEAPKESTQPSSNKSYAVDPYREPVE